MAKRDTQKLWEERINRAKKVRTNWKELFQVDLARDYFDGKQNPGYPTAEWITVNKVYSALKAQLPSLYNQNPYFYVKLRTSFNPDPAQIAMYEQQAKIRQSMLNYLKDELRLKDVVRLCIQDAHFAVGVAKVHYCVDMKENPDKDRPMTGDDGAGLYDTDGAPLLEPEYIPVNERYKITRIHPDDFLWDEDSGPLPDTWKWVAQRIVMTHDDAMADPRFNKSVVKKLKTNGDEQDQETRDRAERKKGGDISGNGDSQFARYWDTDKAADAPLVMWEVYDLKKKTWCVVAEGAEKPLMETEPLSKGTEGHPFALLRFTLRDDSPWPIPPISQGLDVQKEYNIARSRVLTHRKRFNRKYQGVRGGVEEEEISKLESGDDGTFIWVNQIGAIDTIKDAPLDQQQYIEIGHLNNDLMELLGGATPESRGVAGADSATQAGILDKRMEVREGDAMGMVTDFVRDIARKLDQLVQTHITRDMAIRVTGPQGEFWEYVRTDDYEEIDGEFEYNINVGSTIPQLPQMERSSFMALLSLFGSVPQLLTSKRLLQKMAEMHHIEDESMIDEMYAIGQQIMGGQMPQPGQQGSMPNVSENRPVSAAGGQVGGAQSLVKGAAAIGG